MRAHPSRFSSTLTSLGNNQMKIWQFCSILDWISLDKIKAIKFRRPDENVLIFLHTKIKVNGLFKVWEHCDEGHVAKSDDEVESSGKDDKSQWWWDNVYQLSKLIMKIIKTSDILTAILWKSITIPSPSVVGPADPVQQHQGGRVQERRLSSQARGDLKNYGIVSIFNLTGF